VGGALDQSLCLHAVDQLDHAVVPELQPVGQLADGGPVAVGESLERQQEDVLLRGQPVAADGLLAEAQIAADREPELRQCLEVLLGQGLRARSSVVRRHADIRPQVAHPEAAVHHTIS
jgi:hypothetical protein